jgi:N-acetylmuramoyl-L-alanine amidase
MAKKVFIGVGHGGSDPGAAANGLKEKDLNLAIALACQDELARHGVLTKMSRKKDENDPLTDEIKECNAYAPDLAVDVHSNAGGGDGAEVYHSIYGGTGKTLAKNILAEIVELGQNSRGVKTKKNSSGSDYFGFSRQTKAPAVIVECAFVDNKKDIKIIDTKAEQKAMGVAIAKGILKTLGIAWKAPAAPKKETEYVYRVFDKNGKQVGAYGKEANAFDKAKELLKADGSVKITYGAK